MWILCAIWDVMCGPNKLCSTLMAWLSCYVLAPSLKKDLSIQNMLCRITQVISKAFNLSWVARVLEKVMVPLSFASPSLLAVFIGPGSAYGAVSGGQGMGIHPSSSEHLRSCWLYLNSSYGVHATYLSIIQHFLKVRHSIKYPDFSGTIFSMGMMWIAHSSLLLVVGLN